MENGVWFFGREFISPCINKILHCILILPYFFSLLWYSSQQWSHNNDMKFSPICKLVNLDMAHFVKLKTWEHNVSIYWAVSFPSFINRLIAFHPPFLIFVRPWHLFYSTLKHLVMNLLLDVFFHERLSPGSVTSSYRYLVETLWRIVHSSI